MEKFLNIYCCVSDATIFIRSRFEKVGTPFPKDFKKTKLVEKETEIGDFYITYYTYTSTRGETIYVANITDNDEIGDVIIANYEIPNSCIYKQIRKVIKSVKLFESKRRKKKSK